MIKLYSLLLASLILLTPLGMAQAAPAVDINTADSETMVDQLVGIGPQKAMAIVRYRQKNGPFKHVNELVEVSGIGQKTIEQNRSRMTVSSPKTARAR